MLLPVSLVGSYPQPDWLIDREQLRAHSVPRVRARQLWRIPEPFLTEAQRDATLVAIREQEEAGLDIVTDGEIRRESYFNRFATALDGIDLDHPGTALSRNGRPIPVPRIVGPLARRHPVEVEDMRFLRSDTLVLPIRNATVEEFSRYLLQRLVLDCDDANLREIELCVASGPGQKGCAHWRRP